MTRLLTTATALAAALALLPIAARSAGAEELNRYAGSWASTGTFVDTPYSKAGSADADTTCAWSNDRGFMICQQRVTLSGKTEHDLGIYTFDDATNAYHFVAVRTTGPSSPDIAMDSTSVTYVNSFNDNGKQVTVRTTNVWVGPDRYTWRTEYSTDSGATWTLMASGSAQRR